MTIHSELIRLVVENRVKVLFEKNRPFRLMPLDFHLIHERSRNWVSMSPDIVANKKNGRSVAIEVESDIKYDFDNSMRQIRKYLEYYDETKIVIPEEYERFAHLYENEGVEVFIWSGARIWYCMECDNKFDNIHKINVRCPGCNSNQLNVVDILDFDIKIHPH